MALPLVSRKKFEAIIVDCGMEQAGEILEQLRLSPSNRTAVTFAITDPAKPYCVSNSAKFCDRETSLCQFGRPNVESRLRVDRAGTPPIIPLPGNHRSDRADRWHGSERTPGQHQRGWNGDD